MLKKLVFNSKGRNILMLLCLLMIFSMNFAFAATYKNAQLHGFVTQAYSKTNANNFFGNSTGKGSFDYSEIGVNASVKASAKLRFAAQLLSRRAGKIDEGDVKLDFALIDYRIVDKSSFGLGLQAGRVKNPFGFYNETRDVAFTRESIILPQSIYFERTRNVSISSDGLHLYGHKQTSIGRLNAQLVTALPRVNDDNTEYALLNGSRPGSFRAKPSYIGRVRLESNDARLSAALSYVNLNMAYEPTTAEAAALNVSNKTDIQFDLRILSINYNLMKWSFTSEYAQRRLNFTGMGNYISAPVNNKVGESFYLQSVYRLNHQWNFLARYDVLYSDINDRNGELFAQALKASDAKNYSRFSKDFTVGVQFNISQRWMVRVEAHEVDGTAWLPTQDNPDPEKIQRYWRMLNASVSYRF